MIPTKEEMISSLTERHGEKLQKRFSSSSVAICGLGGLGSNIAVCLARAGIGKLYLIDFDKVDISNLNRQQYFVSQLGMYKTKALSDNLKMIAPYVETEIFTVRLNESNAMELLKDCDIVCEAFDKAEEKAMLVNYVLENLSDKYLVAGSGMAGIGSSNMIKTQRITDRFYLCGDNISDVSDKMGLLSSRVAVCAAHQAHMVLRILAGELDA